MSQDELIEAIQKMLENADVRELDLIYRILRKMISK